MNGGPTWSNQLRGGGIGWARQAKKLHMAEKMPLPRNKVARGIGLAFRAETGAEIARSGDQVVDAVAENARRKLWENNTRDPYGQGTEENEQGRIDEGNNKT